MQKIPTTAWAKGYKSVSVVVKTDEKAEAAMPSQVLGTVHVSIPRCQNPFIDSGKW